MDKSAFLEKAEKLKGLSKCYSEPGAVQFMEEATELFSALYGNPKVQLKDWLEMASALLSLLNNFIASVRSRDFVEELAADAMTRVVHIQHDWMTALIQDQVQRADDDHPI